MSIPNNWIKATYGFDIFIKCDSKFSNKCVARNAIARFKILKENLKI